MALGSQLEVVDGNHSGSWMDDIDDDHEGAYAWSRMDHRGGSGGEQGWGNMLWKDER